LRILMYMLMLLLYIVRDQWWCSYQSLVQW
jgi:hypothetical protein